MPRFAANLSTMYLSLPLLDRIAAAAADGFDAVECQLPFEQPAEVIAARLRAAGLPLVLFNAPAGGTDPAGIAQAWQQGRRGVAAIPGHESEFREGFALALHYAQVLDCPRLHVMAGLLPTQGDAAPLAQHSEAARQTFIDNLRWAARQARSANVMLLIEPINGRDMPGYLLQHQRDAHALIDAVAEPNVALQLDLYHCQIMDGDLSTHLKMGFERNRIGHIQIAGVPARHEPDEGEVNYPHLFALIDALQTVHPHARWSGHIGCEYRPARGDDAAAIRAGLDWLRQWRAQQPSRAKHPQP